MDTDISFEIITLYNPSKEPFDIVYNNRIFRSIPSGKAMSLPKKPFGELALKHLIDRMMNENNQPTNDEQQRANWRAKIVLQETKDDATNVIDKEEVLNRNIDRLNNTNESGQIIECPSCGTKTFNLPEHNQLNHPVLSDEPQAPTTATPPPPTPTTGQVAPATPALTATPPQNVEVLPGEGTVALPVDKPAPQTETQKEVANVLQSATRGEGHQLPEQKLDEEEPKQEYSVNPNPTREELIAHAKSIGMNTEDPKTKHFLETADIEVVKKEVSYGI